MREHGPSVPFLQFKRVENHPLYHFATGSPSLLGTLQLPPSPDGDPTQRSPAALEDAGDKQGMSNKERCLAIVKLMPSQLLGMRLFAISVSCCGHICSVSLSICLQPPLPLFFPYLPSGVGTVTMKNHNECNIFLKLQGESTPSLDFIQTHSLND